MMSIPSSSISSYERESTPLIQQNLEGGSSQNRLDGDKVFPDQTIDASSGTITNCLASSGAIRVAVGAALFAGTNAAATALYRRNGSTVVSLYIIRSPIIYFANALIVAFSNHKENSKSKSSDVNENKKSIDDDSSLTRLTSPTMSATNVLLLQTGSRKASQLALIRSLLNSIKAVLLSVGFVFLTYADAFVVFKGVAVCGTLIVARKLLGSNEILAPHELACGMGVVLGILMIAPPSMLVEKLEWFFSLESNSTISTLVQTHQHRFLLLTNNTDETTSKWVVRQTAGMVVAIVSGLMSSVSGTLVRMLSESGGPHDGKAPPAMLLSYLMIVMLIVNSLVVFVSWCVMGEVQSSSSAWAWTAFVWPNDFVDYVLIATNCACTLGGHLATASGYSTTRAGIVAFLQLTEIPWVYLLDVLVLNESTTKWKSIGSAVVFVSAVAVAVLRKR